MRCSFGTARHCAVVLLGGLLTAQAQSQVLAEEPGELLQATKELQSVVSEQIRREVEVQLSATRDVIASDPRGAIDSLKRLHDLVRHASELTAEERNAMQERIAMVLRQASREEVKQTADNQERLANAAAARERQQALATMESRQARLDQLTERFMALVDEDRLDLAEETAAAATNQADSGSTLNASLPVNARARRYVRDALATRIERQRGVVDTLQRVEMAHVPQSDEPPIVYTDAAAWQELTHRRKGRSTDMYREKPAEARIRKALEEQTECDFAELPLGEVVNYLKDRHSIEIQLDTKSLEEIGVSSETLVTLQLKGTTLRSALRHLLRQLDLTYTIQDEVLFITTPEVAATLVVPHVYYVADLVMPIQNAGAAGRMGGFVGDANSNPFSGGSLGQGSTGNAPFGGNNQNGNPFGQNGQNLF